MAKPKAAGEELERLKRQIKNKEAGRLYFFFGEETFLLEYYLGQMKKLLLEELSAYDPSELRQRLSIYERCDKRIRECL